ncbi:MAG: UDP-3-O-(3-hydroxymyristoyl)glucosamine N-acyltransferase [Pseudomonadota bacterium]
MGHSIADIAAQTGLRAEGNLALTVELPAEPRAAGPGDLAMAMDAKYADHAKESAAKAAVLWDGADWQELGFEAALFAARPKLGLAAVGDMFAYPMDLEPGIHPSAIIDPSASLGADCWIGPFTVISAGAQIGAGARIFGQASIGRDAQIGAGAMIHPGVRIGPRVVIGARFFAQYNAVVGAEGYSYLTPDQSAVEAAQASGDTDVKVQSRGFRRIESLGSVRIGDDVDLGAQAAIDRGTISDTVIGRGSKLDNQVMIAHNVHVGEDCMLSAQVGIAGSTTLGDRVVMGGQVGCADHCKIGSDVIIGGGSLIGSNIPPGKVMIGLPVLPRDKFMEQQMVLRRLPQMAKQLAEIRKKLGL